MTIRDGKFKSTPRGYPRDAAYRSILANLRHLPRVHAAAVDLDPGEADLDLAKVRWRELDVDRAHVLAQVIHVGRAGDRDNPWLLRHQPSQRDLRRRCAPFL